MKYPRVMRSNFHKMLDNIKEQYDRETADGQKIWCEELNRMLDTLLSEDFFGTEGQNDPRGDRREDGR